MKFNLKKRKKIKENFHRQQSLEANKDKKLNYSTTQPLSVSQRRYYLNYDSSYSSLTGIDNLMKSF